jgi:hypothetical protein
MLRRVYIFLAVTGLFALLLLSSTRAYARTKETGCVSVLSTNAALTKNHLPRKATQWLSLRLPAHAQERKPLRISGSTSFLRQRARSLPKWNCQSHPITASSKLSFRIRLRSRSILNRVCKSCLSWSVGNLAVTNRSNAGDPFIAFSYFSTTKTGTR